MRILIDTNIIIPLEDSSKILEASFAKLLQLCSENSHHLLIHPFSLDDLERDKNELRKKSLQSRLEKYKSLDNPPVFDDNFIVEKALLPRKDNDRVDNAMLAAVYNNAAHWLITEDRGIHKKAFALGISNKVYYIQQSVEALQGLYPNRYEIELPNIETVFLYDINSDDPFFDSLREDYDGFNEWFKDKQAEGRKAKIVKNEQSEINALLIYKEEEGEIVTNDNRGLPGKSIKLSTLKVGEQVRGQKIGELFLKSAFEAARKNHCDYVYMTIHPEKHKYLKDLCEDFGFYEYGIDIKNNRDLVYVKDVGYKNNAIYIDPFDFYRHYSPSFNCQDVQKYIIPIKPEYHSILFADNQKQRPLISFNKAAGNTIKKAYLSHSPLKHMSPGDLVLFYRSRDWKTVTTLGIVEKFFISNDPDHIASEVAKRTVYSISDIEEMCSKPTRVLLFRQIFHFDKNVNAQRLHSIGVKGNIQSTRTISDDSFLKIIDKAADETCTDIN